MMIARRIQASLRETVHTRTVALAAVLVSVGLITAGCLGENADKDTDAGEDLRSVTEQVDSTERFSGRKRAIAAAIEEYEAAVRAGNPGGLCRRVLNPALKHLSQPLRRCGRDQDNEALRGTQQARKALDLVARRIVLIPQRPRDVEGLPAAVPRYQVEWGLEDAPPAVALVERADRSAPGMDAFGLARAHGEWRIVDRSRARGIRPPAGAGRVRFFQRHGVLGFFGIAVGEPIRCAGREGLITHAIVAPRRASSARDAAMSSNIGPHLRKALRDGATLHASAIDYRGPNRTFTLKLASGRTVVSFDVYGPGPRYTTAGMSGCIGWIERLTDLGIRL